MWVVERRGVRIWWRMGVGRVDMVLVVLVGVGEVGGRRTVGGEWRFYWGWG